MALLPHFLIEKARSGELAQVTPTSIESDKAYWLVCPEERADQPSIKHFRNWLLRQTVSDYSTSNSTPWASGKLVP